MKNIDELYEKYYNDYKNDYDNDDGLDEGKKKKFDYKQFELFDKTDEKLTLDEETKKFFKEIENREKVVDKKKFREYFSYKPNALLVNDLLNQNTQDFKKRFNEIKQQKIKLNEDERNSTNNKNKNERLNMILSVIDRIYQFFEYKFLPGKESDELKITKWAKVNKKRFNEILSVVTKAKSDGLETSADGRRITVDSTGRLLKDTASGKIKNSEFKEEYNNIFDDVEAIVNKAIITRNQEKMAEILSLLGEIPKPSNKKIS